jgi:opacity protein-like surface antigen
VTIPGNEIIIFEPFRAKRSGKGYGIHAVLGVMTDISKKMYTDMQIRYRYANGMAFTDAPGSVKIEFSGFYFNVGIGYRL